MDIRDYTVPEGAIRTVMDVYGETDPDLTRRTLSWTANQIRRLYEKFEGERLYYWGAIERGAYETLVGDPAFAEVLRQKMLAHISEFEEFLRQVPPKEKYGYLDLPAFCSAVLNAPDEGAMLANQRRALRRVQVDHLYVYLDFLKVGRLYAIILHKQDRYRARGYEGDKLQRRMETLRSKLGDEIKDYDPFVVQLYLEVFRNTLSDAPAPVRENAFGRLARVMGVVNETVRAVEEVTAQA